MGMFLSLGLFLFTFLVYVQGVSHSVFGGDSGDIILASWFGGVAHPPGYPLNTVLGWFFTHLPYAATIAFKANLMAAFLMAGVIVVLFLITKQITKNSIIALTSCLILAFTSPFWLYAHVIEVFQLNLLLISLSFYYLICWLELKKKAYDLKYLNMAVLFWGLAVFHHHTSILLAPAIVYFIYVNVERKIKKTNIVRLSLYFLLGFIPYIFIPFAAMRKTPVNWDDPSNLPNFIRLITRGDYGTFVAASHLQSSSPSQRLFQISDYYTFLKVDFGLLALLIVLIGAVFSFVHNKKLFYLILFSFVAIGPFFLFYASFPPLTEFYTGLWERFIIASYFFLTIFLSFGLLAVFKFVLYLYTKYDFKILRKTLLKLLLYGLFLLYPFYLFNLNYSKVDLSKFHMGDSLGTDILSSVEPGSILLVFSDTGTFNAQYIYYTNNKFRNIKLITAAKLRHIEYRREVAERFKDLNIPSNFFDPTEPDASRFLNSMLDSNLDKFNIYSMDYYPNVDKRKWTTSGLTMKLVKDKDYDIEDTIKVNDELFKTLKFNNWKEEKVYGQYIVEHLKDTYYRIYIKYADELIVNAKDDEAKKYLDRAKDIFDDKKDVYIRYGNIFLKNNDCLNARNNFEKVFELDKRNVLIVEKLVSLNEDCLNDQPRAKRYRELEDILKKEMPNESLDSF